MNKLISLCMIVKNEEQVLNRCLDSVKSLVDEIIIVDTGSTDETKEIAQRYTNHVYDFKWINDFSAARNEALKHASGKWILILDADEYIQQGDYTELRKMLTNFSPPAPHGFVIRIFNITGNNNANIMESTGGRLFINNLGISYHGALHEQLRTTEGAALPYTPVDLTVYHTGYTDQTLEEKNKSQRNMGILLGMKEERKNDPYFHFVLANEYKNKGDLDEALSLYKKSMQRTDPDHSWYMHLLDRIIQITLQKKMFRETDHYIRLGLKKWPMHTDFHCLNGILLEQFGYLERAYKCFETCIELADLHEKKNQPYWLTQINYARLIPHQMMAKIAFTLNNNQQYVYHLTSILNMDKNNVSIFKTLLQVLLANETTKNIIPFIEKLYPLTHSHHTLLLLRSAVACGSQELTQYYWDKCISNQVDYSSIDELAVGLLLQFNSKITIGTPELPMPTDLLLCAALVNDDRSFLEYISIDERDHANELYQQILNSIQSEKQCQLLISVSSSALMISFLIRLYQNHYHVLFDHLVSTIDDASFINNLASDLISLGYSEVGITLLSILLDNNQIQAEGFKILGTYSCLLGNIEDGISLFRNSLEIEPAHDLLGFVATWGSEDAHRSFYNHYQSKFNQNELPNFLPLI
ncbi:tetratricopeptide repeat-containing glycosyltransferase family 2 protein [Paenibacillus sp. MMS18-CY102]|uniref:tetratricopeptide repeat-containing glycosyltransferase family 2 protein n=1 Tax=Paenibacillus sp. MMS18-CY102 TaxID=2682849 RepID=UPI001365BDCC|nr:glycosyltransferase family 2 protein [Paenibacillus sp. MMS18-CY102]